MPDDSSPGTRDADPSGTDGRTIDEPDSPAGTSARRPEDVPRPGDPADAPSAPDGAGPAGGDTPGGAPGRDVTGAGDHADTADSPGTADAATVSPPAGVPDLSAHPPAGAWAGGPETIDPRLGGPADAGAAARPERHITGADGPAGVAGALGPDHAAPRPGDPAGAGGPGPEQGVTAAGGPADGAGPSALRVDGPACGAEEPGPERGTAADGGTTDVPGHRRRPPADLPAYRPADVRDTPADDRAIRRAREAAEAARGDADHAADADRGADGGAPPDAAGPCVPEPPPFVNYGRDGVARRDAYLDAAKRADEALRVGVPGAPFEADLVRAYGERLRDHVGPAVRDEVAGLAAAVGATDYAVEVATPDEILAHVREMTTAGTPGARPDYQVGDMPAVRARLTVSDRESLAPALTELERRLGTGDHGRILDIRPTPEDVPITIATTPHDTYELHLHPDA